MRHYVFLDPSMDVQNAITNSEEDTCFLFQSGTYLMEDFSLLPNRDYISAIPLEAILVGEKILRTLSNSTVMNFIIYDNQIMVKGNF